MEPQKVLTAKCQNIGLATSNQTISFRVALNISLSWQLALFPVFSPFFVTNYTKETAECFQIFGKEEEERATKPLTCLA